MNKALLIATTLVLAIGTASAVSINPSTPSTLQDNQTITLDPDGSETFSYEIKLDENTPENETRVDFMQPTNTGDFTISPAGFATRTVFFGDDTLELRLEAPDTGGKKQNISLKFNVTYQEENGNSSTENYKMVEKNFTAETRIPYETLFDNTWLNKSYQLNLDGEKYNISDIGPESPFLSGDNNNSIEIDDQVTINDVRITKTDIIPNKYVKLKAEALKGSGKSASYKLVKSSNSNSGPACKLGISTQGGTVLQRGQQFIFSTINTKNGDSIGGVDYQLRKTTTPGGLIAEGTSSANFASASVPISETLYQNNPEVKKVQLKLIKEGSNCEATSRTISLATPYGDYIENTDKYNLKLKVDNKTVYDKITGTVSTMTDQQIESGVIVVETPSGEEEDTAFNDTGFTYTPSTGGDYKVTATKSGYVKSDTVTVNYIADKDGDGVPNSEDNCPEIEGVEENNGCERIELYIDYIDSEGNRPESGIIKANKPYTFRVFNQETNEIEEDFNSEIPVRDGTRSIPFENGVAENIVFNETGSYEVMKNESGKYSLDERTLTVEKAGFFSGSSNLGIAVFFLILMVGGIVFAIRTDIIGGDDGGSRSRKKSSNSRRKSLQDGDNENLGVDLG